MEKQIEPECRAEEFSQVGRDRHAFGEDPHRVDNGRGEAVAAHLGQVASGRDSQFGRETLNQHRHQVAGDDDPDQHVAELGAALNVGGEIAWINVGDAGDKGWPEKGPEAAKPGEVLIEERIRCVVGGADISRGRSRFRFRFFHTPFELPIVTQSR